MPFNWFSKSVENSKAWLVDRLKDDENCVAVLSGFNRLFIINIFRSQCQSSSSHKIFKFRDLLPVSWRMKHALRLFLQIITVPTGYFKTINQTVDQQPVKQKLQALNRFLVVLKLHDSRRKERGKAKRKPQSTTFDRLPPLGEGWSRWN